MSANRSRSTHSVPKHKKETAQVIAKLNSQLKHLSEHIINQQPYLLSVPTDVPYRHSSRVVNNWHLGTPFAQDEEYLQYMSFLPHQDDEEELLWVQGGWSDEKGNVITPEESPRPLQSTGCNTPSDPYRKKISLKDYKRKDKVGGDMISDAQEDRSDEKRTLEKEPELDNSTTEQILRSEQDAQAEQGVEAGNHAIIGATNTEERPLLQHKRAESGESDRPKKRQRTRSPEIDIKDEEMASSIDAVSKIGSNVPGLLSPTLPSQSKEKNIPRLVSPTLPASIAEYLSTPNSHELEALIDHHRTEPVRSILASAGLTSGSHKRSDSQHSVRSTLSVNSGACTAPSPGLKAGVKTPAKPTTPINNGARASPGPRQRHIIALKYGKKNRKRVEALLKFAPRSKKADVRSHPTTRSPDSLEHDSRNSQQRSQDNKTLLEKSPEIVSKKHKTRSPVSPPERATPTSVQVSNHPENPTASGPAKSTFSTPRKELKATAMTRATSSEGMEARTPIGDRNRLSTPSSTDKFAASAKHSPQPTSAPVSKEQERAAWHALSEQYFALGRMIKREATGISQDNEVTRKESALSVILLIEALLCFMVNHCAEMHHRSNQDPGWQNLLPYHIFVFRAARKFPHLHGIVTQLGAVCRQYIHKFDLDKLAKEPLPEEHIGSAPTPGSDGNTKTTEDVEKYRKKYLDFRDQLVLNSKELQTAWMDGSRELSLDVIEREYPKTWSRRARDSSMRGVVRQSPSKISDDYFLPLDANATAFEAARFTLAFLEEWADREGVEWATRMNF